MNWKTFHACLEGPEAGVYYRGRDEITDSFKIIELPDYVQHFTTELTAHVTPIIEFDNNTNIKCPQIYATTIKNGKFKVVGDKCLFNWVVFGKRGILTIEPKKSDCIIQGDGPYRYII